MITELTPDQMSSIEDYITRYRVLCLRTDPADKPVAECASRLLAYHLGFLESRTAIAWVNSTDEGIALNEQSWKRSIQTLSATLLHVPIGVVAMIRTSFMFTPWHHQRAVMIASLCRTVREEMDPQLHGRIRNRLRGQLRDSLRDELWPDLLPAICATLRDTEWVAYYTYGSAVLGLVYGPDVSMLLRVFNDLLSSCFAVWLTPEMIILCERPESIDSEADARIVRLKWRPPPSPG